MVSEAVILLLAFSGILGLIAIRTKSLAVMLVSTLAEWVTAIRLYQDLAGDALPSVVLVAIGMIQFFILARW